MTIFQYSPEIIAQFPAVVGGVIVAQGMRNDSSSDALRQAFLAEQQAVLARIGDTPLSDLPAVAAWRRAFTRFGVKPTQYRSAVEALLRRLTKQGDIPSINTLVDIGNLISIRYTLPVAVFDRRAMRGAVTVHFAVGSETFTELGAEDAVHPELGEVVFSDEDKKVLARRWCWRQSAESAARDDTTDALITFEAQHENSRREVEQAGAELLELLRQYAGGQFEMVVLSADRRMI
jgi:DNA/RNA-binding domain of Phe-tRNA-synthetase-like protein